MGRNLVLVALLALMSVVVFREDELLSIGVAYSVSADAQHVILDIGPGAYRRCAGGANDVVALGDEGYMEFASGPGSVMIVPEYGLAPPILTGSIVETRRLRF